MPQTYEGIVKRFGKYGEEALSDYNCPASHLVVKAKYAISQYRKRGSSVDGKLDTRSRARHYHMLSLEELTFDDGLLWEEAISDPQGPSRPTEEIAAQQSGLSQPTVSRLLAFVWESCQKPPFVISPRATRITRYDRREKLVALFQNRPAGELVTYEELLALFSDVQSPWYALWMAVSRYNRQLEGAKSVSVKGQGYIQVEEEA